MFKYRFGVNFRRTIGLQHILWMISILQTS
jgi:hypothetical protein